MKHKKSSDLNFKDEIENFELLAFIENNFHDQIVQAINQMAKSERASELNKIAEKIQFESATKWDEESILNALAKVKHKIVRSQF